MAELLDALNYIAGLLDGEGYIGIEKRLPSGPYKSPIYTAKVSVEMAALGPLKFLRKHYKGSWHKRKRKGCKLLYSSCVSSRQAERLLKAVLPFLKNRSKIKATKACLKFLKLSFKHMGQGVRVPASVLKQRESCYQSCKKANKRGG